jgi:hypothetical protein
MTTSISAVVLSIISATSCAFVTFDHQYKASSTAPSAGGRNKKKRRMLMLMKWKERVVEGLNLRSRRVQDDGSNAALPSSLLDEDGNPIDEDGIPIDPNFDLLMEPGVQLTEAEPSDAMAGTVTAPSDTTAGTTSSNGPNSVAGDTMAGTVTDPSGSTNGTTPSNGPNSVGGDSMAGTVTAPSDTSNSTTPSNGPNSVGGDAMAGAVPASGQDEDTGDVDFGPGSNGDSMAESFVGGSSTPQISGGGGGSTYGSSAYGSSSMASASGASAIVKGDAGLFCDTDPSFTYTSLWNGGSVKAFEAEIASESDNNRSEEVARNAVLAAAIVGAFMATILTIECLLGWKMCLEKWFVGFLAMVACISQGVTFAFFNSQRYCDGDLLHEILNQQPCVLGKGGAMSIAALLLYFFTILLVWKVPEGDPYGICCKGRKKDDSEKVFQGDGDGNSGLLMGSNPNNSKPERPNWISEDNRNRDEEEENEII